MTAKRAPPGSRPEPQAPEPIGRTELAAALPGEREEQALAIAASAPVEAPTPVAGPGDEQDRPARLEVYFHEPGHASIGVARIPCRVVWESGGRSAVSDATGRCAFEPLPAGRVQLDTTFDPPRAYRLAPGATVRVVLAVPDALLVTGVVLGPDGSPHAGAEILCAWSLDPESGVPVAVSDPAGRFRLEELHSRSYVFARAPGCARSVGWPVGDPPGPGDLRLRLMPARDYAGEVVDERGAPVAGATVRVGTGAQLHGPGSDGRPGGRVPTRWTGLTDADGRFLVPDVVVDDGLPVVVSAAGYATTVVERVAEPLDLHVRLAAELPVRGTVLDPEGAPVADALVLWGDERSLAHASARTDEAGRFVLGGVPAEPLVRLKAVHGAFRSSELELPDSAVRRGVEIALRPR